jgi:hypothetical protein
MLSCWRAATCHGVLDMELCCIHRAVFCYWLQLLAVVRLFAFLARLAWFFLYKLAIWVFLQLKQEKTVGSPATVPALPLFSSLGGCPTLYVFRKILGF